MAPVTPKPPLSGRWQARLEAPRKARAAKTRATQRARLALLEAQWRERCRKEAGG